MPVTDREESSLAQTTRISPRLAAALARLATLTLAGTSQAPNVRMIKDLVPGSGLTAFSKLTADGKRLFFVANDSVHGREIWV